MIAVGHTSVGVLIGVAANQLFDTQIPLFWQLLAAGMAGVAAHYLTDLLPHGHYDFDSRAPNRRSQILLLIDLGLPVVLVAGWLLWEHGFGRVSFLILFGIGGSQLPDLFEGLLARDIVPSTSFTQKEHRFHMSTHWHNPPDPAKATPQGGRRLGWSDMWQVVIVLAAAWVLISHTS